MNRVRTKVRIKFETEFTLTEIEANALDGLVGYGIDSFLEVFYKKLGKCYLEPHEAGLRSFFKNVQKNVMPAVERVKEARRDLAEAIRAREEQQIKWLASRNESSK